MATTKKRVKIINQSSVEISGRVFGSKERSSSELFSVIPGKSVSLKMYSDNLLVELLFDNICYHSRKFSSKKTEWSIKDTDVDNWKKETTKLEERKKLYDLENENHNLEKQQRLESQNLGAQLNSRFVELEEKMEKLQKFFQSTHRRPSETSPSKLFDLEKKIEDLIVAVKVSFFKSNAYNNNIFRWWILVFLKLKSLNRQCS